MASTTKTFDAMAKELRSGGGVPTLPGTLPPLASKVLARLLLSDVRDRFATGTDPQGKKWRPLKYARPNGGNQPLRDTGRLMASLASRSGESWIEVFTVYPGASLHNSGGVVRPKKAKYLAIPTTKEAKRSGGPRRFKGNLSVRFVKRGVLLLVGGKNNEVQFVLVKSVTIPKREFMGVSEKGFKLVGEALAEFAVRGWIDGKEVVGKGTT